MSCGATAGHRGFDGTRVIVLGAMVPWRSFGADGGAVDVEMLVVIIYNMFLGTVPVCCGSQRTN